MRKIYIDLAIVVFSIWLLVKLTKLFIALVVIGVIVWFFVLDDDKKSEIKDKISSLYR